MKNKINSNKNTPLKVISGGLSPKKKKPNRLKPSLWAMIFYWILSLLLGLAIYFKGKHFLEAHWNKNNPKADSSRIGPTSSNNK